MPEKKPTPAPARATIAFATTLRVSIRLTRGLAAHDAFRSAAAIAFWVFLSVIPLLVFLGFLVGQVARRRGVDALLGPLLDVIPSTADGIVRDEIERLAGKGAATIAPVSVASFLWTASSGLHNLMDVFETMTRAPRRSYVLQRALALAWVLASLVAACLLALAFVRFDSATRVREAPGASAVSALSAAAATASARTPELARGTTHTRSASPAAPAPPGAPAPLLPPKPHHRGGLTTPLGQLVAGIAMLAVATLFLASFYRFAAATRPSRRRHVWPGTLAAMGCFLVVSWAFSAYAASIADYAVFYGSLAAVAVLLVWLYLTSLSLIVGAEVNAMLEE